MEFLKKKGLAIVIVIIALAIIVVLIMQSLKIQDKIDGLQPLTSELRSKEAIKPYPSQENVQVLARATNAWEAQLLEYQKKLPKIEADFLGKPVMSSGAFSAKRTRVEKQIKETYDRKGIFWPEECNLGFETYVSNPVPNKAINILNYELDSIEYILKILAENEISGLRNIVRKPLKIEEDTPKVLVKKGKKPLSKSADDQEVIENLEVELVFTGNENSIKNSLNQLVNTSKYLFFIKSLSLKNSQLLPVDLSLIDFEGEEDGSARKSRNSSFNLAALFGSASSDEEVDEETKTIESKEIFKQVLGDEEVLIGLVLEVVLLREG